MSFTPYIARDRIFQDFHFDFHIVNETGKSWYDGSPNQYMPEREWCVSKIKHGMTVVDCGAHHGIMSLIFANAVGTSGKVIAYEALPSNALVVEQNAELNHFKNIVVRPVGVGESNDLMPISYNESNTVVLQNAIPSPAIDSSNVIKIVRMDDDLPVGTKIDFMKIDVEGFDLQALRGMLKTLAQYPMIDFELHNFLFEDRVLTLEKITSLLNSFNYSWEVSGTIYDLPTSIGTNLQVQHLVEFDNPHLFGTPRNT
jgi:FkbM family methyltransferase